MGLLIPLTPIDKPAKITKSTTNAAGGTSTTIEDGPVVLPDVSQAYLVGSKGVFHLVKNRFYKLVKKVEQLHGLADISEELEIYVTKLPEELFRQIEDFLVENWKKNDGEGVVLLAYNPDTKDWKPLVPKQKVAGSAVDYDMADCPTPEGYTLFGTVHSHPTFSAFHSGTDDRDEFNFDGLHITVGFVNKPTHEYAMRWIINGTARKIEHLESCVQLPERPQHKCDPAWLARAEKRGYQGNTHQHWQGGVHHQGNGASGVGSGVYAGDNEFYYRNRDTRVGMDTRRELPPPLDPAVTAKKEQEAWKELGFSEGDAASMMTQLIALCKEPAKREALKQVVVMLYERPVHTLDPLQAKVLDALEEAKDESVRCVQAEALESSVYSLVDEDETGLFDAVGTSPTAFDSYQREATLGGGRRGNRRNKGKIAV